MNWTTEQMAMLARSHCPRCGGAGTSATGRLCDCVCRRVFLVCHRKFRICSTSDGWVTFGESPRGVDRHMVWMRRNEEYCADFTSAGRRVLSAELLRLFRFRYLLGGAPELVAKRLGLRLRTFYRAAEEVEVRVGRELALMRPYSLYPPHEYLRGGLTANLR